MISYIDNIFMNQPIGALVSLNYDYDHSMSL